MNAEEHCTSSDSLGSSFDVESDSDDFIIDDDGNLTGIWMIDEYSQQNGLISSKQYISNGTKFHFETYKAETEFLENTPFNVDFILDSDLDEYEIKLSATLCNTNQDKHVELSKTKELSNKGDRITIIFGEVMQSAICSSSSGFLNKGTIMVIIKLSKYEEEDNNELVTPAVPITRSNLPCSRPSVPHSRAPIVADYSGILNQGATCYMNSMLQSLFHLPYFRQFVYNIPITTESSEDESKNVVLNLQRLFAMLQFSKKACSTKALTVSFGWDQERTGTQHDAQEFCRVLLDNLNEKVKNFDNMKDGINDLFRGESRSYIRCSNVDFESSRTEYFYDISIPVQGCSTLEQSFKKYLEHEKLTGDNQYNTGDPQFGKQDAMMGVEFLSFPPVLHLHLNRFTFDYEYFRRIKINDRFEFPKEIDLDPFLAKDADHSKSSIYDLYGVLVHSGNANYGHYYAFLRTSTSVQWYKFNDSSVTQATEDEAINQNFGGVSTNARVHNSFSAYILVYVRRSESSRIFQPIKEDLIPQSLREYVEQQSKVNPATKPTKAEEKTVEVSFCPEESIVANVMLNSTGFFNHSMEKKITIKESESAASFYQKVAQRLNLGVDEIRIWYSMNGSVPNLSCFNEEKAKYDYARYSPFFVQRKTRTDPLKIVYPDFNIYIKFFDRINCKMLYLGSMRIDANQEAKVIYEKVRTDLSLPSDVPLSVYEENLENLSVIFLDLKENLALNSYLKTSMVLIFQIPSNYNDTVEINYEPYHLDLAQIKADPLVVNEQFVVEQNLPKIDTVDVPISTPISTVSDYFNTYISPVINFILYNYDDPENSIKVINCHSSLTFEEFVDFIGQTQNLNYDKEKDTLLIYKKDISKQGPYSSFLTAGSCPCVSKIYPYAYDRAMPYIYYRYLPGIAQKEMKSKQLIRVKLSTNGFDIIKQTFVVIPKKNSTAVDIEDAVFSKIDLMNELGIDPDSIMNKSSNAKKYTNVRLMVLSDSRIEKFISENTPITTTMKDVRIDFIPEDKRVLQQGEMVLQFAFAMVDNYQFAVSYGTPFTLVINNTMTVLQLKELIGQSLKLDEKEIKVMKLFPAGISVQLTRKTELMDDTVLNCSKDLKNGLFVVLSMKKKVEGRSQTEKALRIDN